MFVQSLEELFTAKPFEPFRLRLVNGDSHDIFYPHTVSLLSSSLNVYHADGNWAIIPYDKIAAIESLIADFQGHLST